MTSAERDWCDQITRLGCIVCYLHGFGHTPAAVHHILKGGRRIGHMHTIPLCYTHHNSGVNTRIAVSRHPYRAEFERRYGTESYLLGKTRELVCASTIP